MDKTRNLRYLRMTNRAAILRRLATIGPATRKELTARLGLTKMAISTIITEMLQDQLVFEQEPAPAVDPAPKTPPNDALAAGRRPALLALRPTCAYAFGLYLSRDAIEGVLCDLSGHCHQEWQATLSGLLGKTDYLERLDALLDQMLAAGADLPVAGIGISCIGPVDTATGCLLAPPNFYGIQDLPLLDHIRHKSGLPACLDNDMNAAVLAEQLFGAARNLQHVAYVGLTNGIGAGIISYGRIFQGAGGFGGEFGHTSVNMDGPVCSCGNRGCLELYASIPAIAAQAGVGTLDELISQSAGCPTAMAVWRPRLMQVLTVALTNLANLFDPDIILLGHQGVRLAPLLLPDLEIALNQRIFQRQSRQIPIRPAAFGEKTPLIGAACQVFLAIFRGELALPMKDSN